jgi:hypothetical protein
LKIKDFPSDRNAVQSEPDIACLGASVGTGRSRVRRRLDATADENAAINHSLSVDGKRLGY